MLIRGLDRKAQEAKEQLARTQDAEAMHELLGLGHEYGEAKKIRTKQLRKEREEARAQEKELKGIERNVVVFLVFTFGGALLSISSLTITGNVISDLTQTSPGLLGVFMFVAGLAGMFFYLRKKEFYHQ
jgi:hypothetical protein